ncbi:MAG: type II methionyl aminopeptidase [Acidilobaceae archaeon]|nr:type II methionyl aminopeptidase [Acidilobaceae archaeon]MCX8165485.1 type II methionyl aminopeptidase [Acidilobaceae archaeon]MDW7973912.1 type II methionyl aminopeptidase [Sulfolobales archaeon]
MELEKLKLAGKIAEELKGEARRLVKPGRRASEICERLEALTIELGGSPAFPCNFSVNSVAAHYTPGLSDDLTLGEKDVVKVDVGVHVDGYIADTAITIDLSGEHGKLLEAAERALEEAVSTLKPFVSLYEIGRAVESAIKSFGFKPVRNLSGHTIGRYVIHAGLSIPNYADRALWHVRVMPGMLIAIEPFATNGKGLVREGGTVNIFSLSSRRPRMALSEGEEKLLSLLAERYRTLPFTPRWLRERGAEVFQLFSSLRAKGAFVEYPVLVEVSNGLVSQFEHTVYVGEKEAVLVA